MMAAAAALLVGASQKRTAVDAESVDHSSRADVAIAVLILLAATLIAVALVVVDGALAWVGGVFGYGLAGLLVFGLPVLGSGVLLVALSRISRYIASVLVVLVVVVLAWACYALYPIWQALVGIDG